LLLYKRDYSYHYKAAKLNRLCNMSNLSTSSIELAKCILVIGATSGIGRSLAISLKRLESKPTVIAAGRRQDRLDELKAEYGLETIRVDVNTDSASLKAFVDETFKKYPDLDAVIFSSGVQYMLDFGKSEEIQITDLLTEINTNYTSIVVMSSFFIPHFLKLKTRDRRAWIMPISSGLALVHEPRVPNYSAIKAALHSFTASLRVQLRETTINVIEIIPPLVESEIHDAQGNRQSLENVWMSLEEYTTKTMEGLRRGDLQVAVGSAASEYIRFEKLKLDALHKRFNLAAL